MEIDGNTSNNGSYESNVVIKNINKRLRQLNANYIVKLKGNDRRNAKQLLDEIKYLVSSIPQNVDISFGMGVEEVEEVQVEVNKKMINSKFQMLMSDLKDESFEEERVSILAVAANKNYFDVAQGKQILGVFDFADEKLSALRVFYPKVLDPDNAFQLLKSFDFDDEKNAAKNIIQAN
jgi:hypothetical protein